MHCAPVDSVSKKLYIIWCKEISADAFVLLSHCLTSRRVQRGKKRTSKGLGGTSEYQRSRFIEWEPLCDTTSIGAMLVQVSEYWWDTNPEKSVWDGVTGFPWQRDGRAGTLSTICIIYWLGGAKCGPCINSFPVKWNKERVASAAGIIWGSERVDAGSEGEFGLSGSFLHLTKCANFWIFPSGQELRGQFTLIGTVTSEGME